MRRTSFKVLLQKPKTFDIHMIQAARDFWRAKLAEIPPETPIKQRVAALQWATSIHTSRIYRLLDDLGIDPRESFHPSE